MGRANPGRGKGPREELGVLPPRGRSVVAGSTPFHPRPILTRATAEPPTRCSMPRPSWSPRLEGPEALEARGRASLQPAAESLPPPPTPAAPLGTTLRPSWGAYRPLALRSTAPQAARALAAASPAPARSPEDCARPPARAPHTPARTRTPRRRPREAFLPHLAGRGSLPPRSPCRARLQYREVGGLAGRRPARAGRVELPAVRSRPGLPSRGAVRPSAWSAERRQEPHFAARLAAKSGLL